MEKMEILTDSLAETVLFEQYAWRVASSAKEAKAMIEEVCREVRRLRPTFRIVVLSLNIAPVQNAFLWVTSRAAGLDLRGLGGNLVILDDAGRFDNNDEYHHYVKSLMCRDSIRILGVAHGHYVDARGALLRDEMESRAYRNREMSL